MGLSFPHFLNTPKRFQEVNGLQPDPTKHMGYLDVEPQLGIPMGAKISMQGTIAVKAISSVPSMSKLPTVVLPLFWVHEVKCYLILKQILFTKLCKAQNTVIKCINLFHLTTKGCHLGRRNGYWNVNCG